MIGFDDTQIMGERYDFPTTSWTLVRAAKDVRALERLITLYWKPLYFFVRQRGYSNENAKDLVQGFLTHFLEHHAFSKADPARGRFRGYLLAALENYMKDALKAQARTKRGGDETIFSLDFAQGETEYAREVERGEPPEAVLNRAWARGLWRHALKELQGRPEHLKAFQLYLADADYPEICRETGLSPNAARTAVHRLKGQLRELLLGHIRETVSNETDLKIEVEEFKSLLS